MMDRIGEFLEELTKLSNRFGIGISDGQLFPYETGNREYENDWNNVYSVSPDGKLGYYSAVIEPEITLEDEDSDSDSIPESILSVIKWERSAKSNDFKLLFESPWPPPFEGFKFSVIMDRGNGLRQWNAFTFLVAPDGFTREIFSLSFVGEVDLILHAVEEELADCEDLISNFITEATKRKEVSREGI